MQISKIKPYIGDFSCSFKSVCYKIELFGISEQFFSYDHQ